MSTDATPHTAVQVGLLPDGAHIAVQHAVDQEDDPAQEDERQLVAKWTKKIQAARQLDKLHRSDWQRWMRYAAGRPQPGEPEWLVDTNLIESTIEGLVPHIYAQDPDVSVSVAESVSPQQYGQVRQFAKTLEIVVSRLIGDAAMKGRIQRMVRAAMVTGCGWVKVSMQMDKATDPIIERRISDLQDQIKRIGMLTMAQTDSTLPQQDQEAMVAELKHQIESLQAKVEVMIARGIAVDVISTLDIQVDGALREVADYRYADWIAQRIWYTKDAAMAEFGMTAEEIKSATTTRRGGEDEALDGEVNAYGWRKEVSTPDDDSWLSCWEIWDKGSGTVYTWLEGMKAWAKDPYPPSPCGSRFYPFFMLGFHWQPDMRFPQPDVQMWHKLQDEYSRTRSSFALHRRRAIPARVFDKRSISLEDAKKISNPDTLEMVGVDRNGDAGPVNNVVGIIPYPPVDAGLYDTSVVRSDLEQVSGLSDAMRTTVVQPKTATEANIVANSAANRLSTRQDAVEDMLEEVVVWVSELALQAFTAQDAMRYAGAGCVWPQMPLEQIHSLLNITITAGTSGKPNTQADQQLWTQLGPQLWQAVTSIDGAMKSGDMGLAEAYKGLLQLTLDRFGVKMDAAELVPQQPPQPRPPPPDAVQDDVLIRNGTMTIDEARAKRGMPPLPGGLGAIPLVYTKTGAVPLSQAITGGFGVPQEFNPTPPMAFNAPLPQPAAPQGGPMPQGMPGGLPQASPMQQPVPPMPGAIRQ